MITRDDRRHIGQRFSDTSRKGTSVLILDIGRTVPLPGLLAALEGNEGETSSRIALQMIVSGEPDTTRAKRAARRLVKVLYPSTRNFKLTAATWGSNHVVSVTCEE